jgi:hypothetical protein
MDYCRFPQFARKYDDAIAQCLATLELDLNNLDKFQKTGRPKIEPGRLLRHWLWASDSGQRTAITDSRRQESFPCPAFLPGHWTLDRPPAKRSPQTGTVPTAMLSAPETSAG